MDGGGKPPPFNMTLTSFQTTRFGEWLVKLSHVQDKDSFLIVAHHVHDASTIIRTFDSETEVILFVNLLGEKYE